jgi:hypothetical protein
MSTFGIIANAVSFLKSSARTLENSLCQKDKTRTAKRQLLGSLLEATADRGFSAAALTGGALCIIIMTTARSSTEDRC